MYPTHYQFRLLLNTEMENFVIEKYIKIFLKIRLSSYLLVLAMFSPEKVKISKNIQITLM